MKYIFIALLFTCICLFGRMIAAKYKKRTSYSDKLLLFFDFCFNEVRFRSLSVYQILQKFNLRLEEPLPFLLECEEPVKGSIKRNLYKETVLSKEQKELITEFFEEFGYSDEEGSLKLITHYKMLFAAQGEEIKKQCQSKIKLVSRLSVLLAAGICIILL